MDNLINRIIDIEESAQALTRDARDKVADFDRDLRQEVENLRREIGARADEEIAKVREAEEARGLARMKAQDDQFAQSRAILLEKRERGIDQWADDMFAGLIDVGE